MRSISSRGTRHSRGNTMVISIVLSVVISALVSAMCWVASESSQRVSSLSKIDQAFFAAEAGAQRVQWFCKNNQMGQITSPLTGTINGCGYSTSWSTVSGSTIRITSTAGIGTVSYSIAQTVTPPAGSVPVIATPSNFSNRNMTVIGNVVVSGKYTNTGTSGTLTGNMTYGTTATNTGGITGTITQDPNALVSIDFTALGTTLQNAATLTYSGNQANKTFDFTAMTGTNKVIYVNGNVTHPIFIGSGTIYINGKATLDDVGSAGSPVNIVTTQDITVTANSTIYGGFYAGDNLKYGKFDLTGLLYSTNDSTDSSTGTSSMTYAAPPWFDPRMSSGGGGSVTTVTNFSGPMP